MSQSPGMSEPAGPVRPLRLLLVEDSPGDARLVREALRDGAVPAQLTVVTDGEAALDVLHRRGAHAQALRPDLMILDLNLPKTSGREVLADVKADPALRCLPVVVLSTSGSEEDIKAVYELHANCYVRKPVELDEFLRAVKGIAAFWLTVVRLPADPSDG